MLTKPEDIRVVVPVSSTDEVIKLIADSLTTSGVHCRIECGAANLDSDDDFNLVLVDAREGLSSAVAIPDGLPVVAVVEPHQSTESLSAIIHLDDIVTTTEIGSAVFLFRLQRLVGRYQNPLMQIRRGSPESDFIRTLINSTRDQIYVKDLDHRFIFASDQFAESNGLEMTDVIGKDDIEIGSYPIDVHGSPELGWLGFWAQDDAAVNSGTSSTEINPEWRALVEDTQENRVMRVPLKNHHGEVYALLVVSSDMSNTKSNVVDVKARGAILDRALGAMQKAQSSQQTAERAVREKNKLLAAASHDLRQPLHAMGLFLDVLERRIQGQHEQDLIAKIKRSSEALSVLFNSLLDISRLDAGVVRVNREHFLIHTILDALRAEFSEIGLQKNLHIHVQRCAETVYTDPVLLERILRNLIQNAVTYTEVGSVQVVCQATDNRLELSVIDTGPGIALEEQSEVFSEYYQIEQSEHSSTKGLGLGLAIVRRLAGLLEMDVTLYSEPGHGACFCVSLPLGEAARSKVVSEMESSSVLNGQTIVIIDDESDILEGMASMLIDFDCYFITAESTAEALDLLLFKDIVPDIIIADYRLKHGLTGEQAISDIREEFSLDIPAIIVTGDTSADRLKEATRSGCQLLHKPVNPSDLIRAISESAVSKEPEFVTVG